MVKNVIYIPGLNHEREELCLQTYASRLMKAIDENAASHANTYRIETRQKEYDRDGTLASVVSIYEQTHHSDKRENTETEIYRLFEFRYGKFLTNYFTSYSVMRKVLVLALIMFMRGKSLVHSIFSIGNGVNARTKAQAFYFLILYLCICAVFMMLIPSVITVLDTHLNNGGALKTISELSGIKNLANIPYIGGLFDPAFIKGSSAVFIALSSLLLFRSGNGKDQLGAFGIELVGAHQYLTTSAQKQLILGKLSRLLEVICEEIQENETPEIEMHAYSFGSVIALDFILPVDSPPNTRIQRTIKHLLTIGCPYDFIDTYWKGYFKARKFEGLALTTWQNVNAYHDVLSSNFVGEKEKQITFVEDQSFWQTMKLCEITYNRTPVDMIKIWHYFAFYGLKAHSMYWDDNLDSKSCLLEVIRKQAPKA